MSGRHPAHFGDLLSRQGPAVLRAAISGHSRQFVAYLKSLAS